MSPNPAVLTWPRAVAAGGLSYSYITTLTNATTATTYQWTSASLGATATDRWIIAVVECRGGVNMPTFTVDIAGSRATQDYRLANYSHVSFHRLSIPAGTTATIDLTVTGGDVNPSGVSVSLYRITGTSTLAVADTYGGSTPVVVTCATGDVVLAGCVKDAVLTWTGASVDYVWTRPWGMHFLSTQAASAGDLSISATGGSIQAAGIAYTIGA